MDKYLSNKISFFHFLGVFLVLSLHAFLPEIEDSPFQNVQTFWSNYFTRVYHPMMFGISGYLFFYGLKSDAFSAFLSKYKRRIHSLLIPYALCNIIGAFFILWCNQYHLPSGNIADTVGYYETHNLLLFLFHKPALGQLWFVRDLMIISMVTYPLYKLLKNNSLLTVLGLIVCYLVINNSIILSLTAFSIGAVFAVRQVDVQKEIISFPLSVITAIAFLGVCFYFDVQCRLVMLLSWIPFYALWFTYDRLSPLHGLSQTGGGKLILHHTFFVYVFHDPLMSIIKWSLLNIYNSHIWLQPIVYLMLPILLYVLLAIMAEGCKMICPKGYATLMGER